MAAPIPEALRDVKALTFDVFGTVVDWRSSVQEELTKRAREKIASPAFASLPEPSRVRLEAMTTGGDWAAFAQAWRTTYYEFTRDFVPGESAWKDIDAHHYDSLQELLRGWGLEGVYADEEVRSLSLVVCNIRGSFLPLFSQFRG